MDRRDNIDERFYRGLAIGEGPIIVTTVGELRSQLSCLPEDLPILEDNRQLVVYNITTNPVLAFEEEHF